MPSLFTFLVAMYKDESLSLIWPHSKPHFHTLFEDFDLQQLYVLEWSTKKPREGGVISIRQT